VSAKKTMNLALSEIFFSVISKKDGLLKKGGIKGLKRSPAGLNEYKPQ
jgi:hypothetical protein